MWWPVAAVLTWKTEGHKFEASKVYIDRLCLNSSSRNGSADRVSRCIPLYGLRQTRPAGGFHEDGIREEQAAGRTGKTMMVRL